MSAGGPADVQIARPPAFGRHVDEPPQFDLLRIVGKGLDGKVAVLIEIFQAAFDDERIISQRQFQEDFARQDEMILPEGDFFDLARLILLGPTRCIRQAIGLPVSLSTTVNSNCPVAAQADGTRRSERDKRRDAISDFQTGIWKRRLIAIMDDTVQLDNLAMLTLHEVSCAD